MSAEINVTLSKMKLLSGIKKIEIWVDGEYVKDIAFGETAVLKVPPGRRIIMMILHGVLERRSNVLSFDVAEGAQLAMSAKYSRLWGTIKLKRAE